MTETLGMTLPMAILVTPLLGVLFANPADRAESLMLFWRGMLRWILTFSILFTTLAQSNDLFQILGIPLFFGGCYILWDSAYQGEERIPGARSSIW